MLTTACTQAGIIEDICKAGRDRANWFESSLTLKSGCTFRVHSRVTVSM
jgi:hypothetical protein